MKKKPKKPHRSKAQKEAGKDFAAGGRRALAKARAAPGYKPSKAQVAAGNKFAAAGRRAQARSRAGLPPLKHKLSHGDVACCAAEAVAASLRLHGAHVTEEDMLRLYWGVAHHPDDGALLGDILAASGKLGLAGRIPSSASRIRPASITDYTPGMILGWDDWEDGIAHAAVWKGPGIITWGELADMPSQPDEAWTVNWARR